MTATEVSPADRELIEHHGITVVRADHFLVDGYRYSKLADALAQAARTAALR